MKPSDFAKYTELLLRVYALQDQVRKDPPDDPAEYLSLINEINSLWNEIALLTKDSGITKKDIRAAHAMNQTTWEDTKPSKPTIEYPAVFDGEYPGDQEAIKRGFVSGRDYILLSNSPVRWAVQNARHLALEGFEESHKIGALGQ